MIVLASPICLMTDPYALLLTGAWASGVFTASLAGAASLASPFIIAFLGMIAASIIGIALAVVSKEYFSFYTRKKINYV